MKAIKKAVNGTTTTKTTIRPGATKDSTGYYDNKAKILELKGATSDNLSQSLKYFNARDKAKKDQDRQKLKGKLGYDRNGYPINKNGGSVKAKDGKWMQKAAASIKRRGTEGKCTPITKPGCTGKAKALAKTFKKIAKSNKKK